MTAARLEDEMNAMAADSGIATGQALSSTAANSVDGKSSVFSCAKSMAFHTIVTQDCYGIDEPRTKNVPTIQRLD